jgi:hypothetical protein
VIRFVYKGADTVASVAHIVRCLALSLDCIVFVHGSRTCGALVAIHGYPFCVGFSLSAHAHDMARGVEGARRTTEGHMTLVAYGNVFPYPMMECALDQHCWLR